MEHNTVYTYIQVSLSFMKTIFFHLASTCFLFLFLGHVAFPFPKPQFFFNKDIVIPSLSSVLFSNLEFFLCLFLQSRFYRSPEVLLGHTYLQPNML